MTTVKELMEEVREALAVIGIGGIVSHLTSTVVEYVESLIPSYPLPEVVGFGTVICLLKKLHDSCLLGLGYIHHASIDELPKWMGLVENAKNSDEFDVS